MYNNNNNDIKYVYAFKEDILRRNYCVEIT